jgi:hypothetical protein
MAAAGAAVPFTNHIHNGIEEHLQLIVDTSLICNGQEVCHQCELINAVLKFNLIPTLSGLVLTVFLILR